MKALSIRQPWAWAILHAGKRIENRSRADGRMPSMCSYRGPLLIHASAGCTRDELDDAMAFIQRFVRGTVLEEAMRILLPSHLPRGGIVGVCNVVGHVEPTGLIVVGGTERRPEPAMDKRWHEEGSYGLVLADVQPIPFLPYKGALGLFEVPDELVRDALAAGGGA